MAKVVADIGGIAKISSPNVNYKFRGIDDVMNALHKPLAEHGLFLAPRVLDDWKVNMIPGTNNRTQSQALFRICVDVYHKDGTMMTLGPGLAQSHDYGDKAVYQASQNAIKYLLLNAFSIPTGDVDMDSVTADDVHAVREDVAQDPADWLARAVRMFKEWSEDERREAYKTAVKMLAVQTPLTMPDAEMVHDHMKGAYCEAFPASDERPF